MPEPRAVCDCPKFQDALHNRSPGGREFLAVYRDDHGENQIDVLGCCFHCTWLERVKFCPWCGEELGII